MTQPRWIPATPALAIATVPRPYPSFSVSRAFVGSPRSSTSLSRASSPCSKNRPAGRAGARQPWSCSSQVGRSCPCRTRRLEPAEPCRPLACAAASPSRICTDRSASEAGWCGRTPPRGRPRRSVRAAFLQRAVRTRAPPRSGLPGGYRASEASGAGDPFFAGSWSSRFTHGMPCSSRPVRTNTKSQRPESAYAQPGDIQGCRQTHVLHLLDDPTADVPDLAQLHRLQHGFPIGRWQRCQVGYVVGELARVLVGRCPTGCRSSRRCGCVP